MFVKILLVSLLACVHTNHSASAPFITRCKENDSKCMKSSAQIAIPIFAKGIPELGVKSLDPFFMKKLDASSPNLKLFLKDITGTGLSQCIAKKIAFDSAKLKLIVKLQCDVEFRGQYEMDGNLLILPIQGKGRALVELKKIYITADVDMEEKTGQDGQKHWNIKSYKHSYELKDKSRIELDNLFNGNEALGRAAKEIISTNSNEVVTEVAPPIISAVVDVIVGEVKNFFKNVPLNELIEY